MSQIDPTSFLVIVVAAATAGILRTLVERRLLVPVVVIELVLGILIGPHVAGIAKVDQFTDFFGNLGLAMLFFFAGYEIDFDRIKGRALELAVVGWLCSLVLAFGFGGLLALAGVVLSLLYTGSAMATTAMGMLVPILADSGELKTKFGTHLLAIGAIGEFGPIALVTLFLSSDHPLAEAALLVGFVAVAVLTGLLAVRSVWRGWPALERSLETSSQLAVRLMVVLVFSLVALASELGLDVLLGGFVAGLITRAALRGREVRAFESKTTALGYGFLIPFFFITSGMKFDATSLVNDPKAVLRIPLFLVLFLVVRGLPVLMLYRRRMGLRDRFALGFFASTQLPMVVAITTVAVAKHHMKPVTAASLVAAGILSTLIYPIVAVRLRGDVYDPLSTQEMEAIDSSASGAIVA
jgi:Kef-type K+ transport system membrane component KefB